MARVEWGLQSRSGRYEGPLIHVCETGSIIIIIIIIIVKQAPGTECNLTFS